MPTPRPRVVVAVLGTNRDICESSRAIWQRITLRLRWPYSIDIFLVTRILILPKLSLTKPRLISLDDALRSLENALSREREFPNLKTDAWSEFAIFVATMNLKSQFSKALEVLSENLSILLFPVEKFKWHAASALILAAQGERKPASQHATKALETAQARHSGFRYHPTVGLVRST
jgi:hypothetical protein